MNNNKVVNFFVGTPKYNEDKDYADYASFTAPLNMFFLIGLLLHTFYLVIFSFVGIPMLEIFDGIAVILYATFVILLKNFKGSWLPCTLLTIFELALHEIMCVYYFGLDPGFQYLSIPLLLITVFIRKESKIVKFARNAIIIITTVSFVFILIYFNENEPIHYHPVYTMTYGIKVTLTIANAFTGLFVTSIYAGKVFHSIDDKRSQLGVDVAQRESDIENMQNEIIIGFANIIEARDGSTGKHVKRTSEYVEALVKELKRNGDYADILTEKYMHDTMMSAPLHDIGKITIPDAILTKPGRLTQTEFNTIKNHTINGKNIIEESMSDIEDGTFIKVAKSVALYHHECWDGSGYPYGIEGEQIPLCARIMTIADYFDALVAKRSYKASLPTSVVFDNISEQRGKKFDPIIVDAFLRIRDQIDEIAKANAD